MKRTTLQIIVFLTILNVSCKKETKMDEKPVVQKPVVEKAEFKNLQVNTLEKAKKKNESKKKQKRQVPIDTLIIQKDTLFIKNNYFLNKTETYAKCKGKLNDVDIYFIAKTNLNSDYSYCIGTNPKRNKKNENNLTLVLLYYNQIVYELNLNSFISSNYDMFLRNPSDIKLNEVSEIIELSYYQAFCGGVNSTLCFFRKGNKLIKGFEINQFGEPGTEYFEQQIIAPKNDELNQIWVENKVGASDFTNGKHQRIVYFTDIEKYELQNDSIIKLNPKKNNFYYVTAKSGLRQRTGPFVNRDTLELLPYKTKVNVLNETDIKLDLYDDGKLIEGSWVQISYKNDYNYELSSYVFDGFLSKNKPTE